MKIKGMKDLKVLKFKFLFCSALFIIYLIFFDTGCKEPFHAEIDEKIDAIAVDGSLIKGREKQTVVIARSSPLDDIVYSPVTGCQVMVMDENENEFYFTEETEGKYTAVIDDNQLEYNRQYKLVFNTPDGNTYESSWETIIETAVVDSVYPDRETLYNSSEQKDEDIVQFYLDLKAPETGARYYRWELTETYEIHSYYYINYIYDGDTILPVPNMRDSVYYCWITSDINELYSSNTVNLVINEKKKIPLNHALATSRKLAVRYSLLIEQYALNEKAYDFWNQKKIEIQESGGLYTAQPGQSTSNIVNIDDADEKVLGYFWASSLSVKRIFFHEPFTYRPPFGICEREDFSIDSVQDGPFPVYITGDITLGILYTADQKCFDCTLIGGSLEKPDFWE